jgi:biopolymer transport protein ExbB
MESIVDIELLKNIVDYGVIGLLGFMSFLSFWLYIERLLFYKNIDIKNYSQKEQLEIDLTNNISIISSFGSNAPYIGLLGTVFGIIITFYTMGQSGDIDVKTIMSSLGLALKATAMGLVVAIPAIMFYNHLTRKIEVKLALWDMEFKSAA